MQTEPDFVVVSRSVPTCAPDTFDLFKARTVVRVLTLEKQRGEAFLTELIGDISPDELATALWRAAEREAL